MSDWSERLMRLGLRIQTHVARLMQASAAKGTFDLAGVVAEESGDRIYAIDREVEPLIEAEIAAWPDECFPLRLIAEGIGHNGVKVFGDPGAELRWRVIIDPIDGTRMLMYDKRPAWFLAAAVPERGPDTTLRDAVASVLIELPTSRQHLADAFLAEFDQPARGLRFRVRTDHPPAIGDGLSIPVRPSRSSTLQDGFVTVVGCFAGTRRLAADLMERIAEATGNVTAIPQFFDDQYISTGGQMVQLMTGRDRCCIDLRPLFNRILGRTGDERFLEVHPYDVAGLLALENSGAIVTDGFGQPLAPPLDVTTGIHWCGYANREIHQLIEPVVREWLIGHGLPFGA